jgi:topoisomerase-4 subunit B
MKNCISLEDKTKHVRLHPELYISNIGDDSSREDGVYCLIRKVIESNLRDQITEFDISINNQKVTISDHAPFVDSEFIIDVVSGRPLGIGSHKVGLIRGKYYIHDLRIINLLSSSFVLKIIKGTSCTIAAFTKGELLAVIDEVVDYIPYYTEMSFIPDEEIFGKYHYNPGIIEVMIKSFESANQGLKINLNSVSGHHSGALIE